MNSPDPFGPWTRRRRIIWLVLLLFVCLWRGPSFIRSLRPPADQVLDFAQEWTAARNVLDAAPVYERLPDSLARHLNATLVSNGTFLLEYNAHPPTSVLLALPLARLGYSDAFFVWNLFSLGCLAVSLRWVVRELELVFVPFSLVPCVTFLLMCNPLRQQINQGQLNLVLLALLTGVWVADRRGRPGWAGTLLGAAAAVKLFPGFLFLYFALRRRWRVIGWGLVSLAACTAATLAVIGADAYRDYFSTVVGHVAQLSDWWMNASLAGFFNKLFNPVSGHVSPLVQSPAAARIGWLVSAGLLLAVWAATVRRATALGNTDHALAVTLPAMLLLSPITWDHYFLLLLLPLALTWVSLARGGPMRWLFVTAVVCLWLNPAMVWGVFFPRHAEFNGVVASAWQTIALLEYPFYTLLGVFALTCIGALRPVPEAEPTPRQTVGNALRGVPGIAVGNALRGVPGIAKDSRLAVRGTPQRAFPTEDDSPSHALK